MRIKVLDGLARRKVFSVEEAERISGIDKNVLKVILSRLEKKGWISFRRPCSWNGTPAVRRSSPVRARNPALKCGECHLRIYSFTLWYLPSPGTSVPDSLTTLVSGFNSSTMRLVLYLTFIELLYMGFAHTPLTIPLMEL